MADRKLASFSYYFLNKRLHPPAPSGFRTSLIIFIVNNNPGKNKGKFLMVRQDAKALASWSIPKEGTESSILADDVFTTIARNIEEELGFKGIKVNETKPAFKQIGIIFDFAIQKYDAKRAAHETSRNRPSKGKIYHLAIMEYIGPDEMPINSQPNSAEISQAIWVDAQRGRELAEQSGKTFQESSAKFNVELQSQILETYSNLKRHLVSQPSLF